MIKFIPSLMEISTADSSMIILFILLLLLFFGCDWISKAKQAKILRNSSAEKFSLGTTKKKLMKGNWNWMTSISYDKEEKFTLSESCSKQDHNGWEWFINFLEIVRLRKCLLFG